MYSCPLYDVPMAAKRRKTDGKTATILIRVEPAEKDGFRAAADVAGIDLSAWIRERLRRAARQELEEARQPIPFIRPLNMD
jgi:hypothetical protein